MPPRLSADTVRRRFSRYGFTILDPNFVYRNAKQHVRVRDDITNRTESITIDALQKRINRGRAVEVDPFLHALHRTDTLTLTTPGRQHVTRLDRAIRRFATTQMPQFLQEDRSLQRQAIDIASRLNATVRRGRDVTITRTHEPDTDRAQLYAFINTLYTVAELHQRDRFRNKRITVSVKANGIASGAASPMESFMYINDNTIAMLSDLIQHVYFDEPLHEISDSSTAVLFSIVDWESMSILFFDAHSRVPNPLDGPRVADDPARGPVGFANEVGSEFMGDDDGDAVVADLPPRRRRRTRNVGSLWRYLNKTDIDLSRYGIFTSFDVANYRYSCFIYALQQSGQFTPEEIDLINDSINTRAFPCDTIAEICRLYDCHIIVEKVKHSVSSKSAHIKTARYGDASASRCVSLLLRDTHYMINEPVPVTEYYLANINRIASSPRVNQSRRFECRNLTDKSVNYKKDPRTSLNKFLDMMFKHRLFRRFTPSQSFRALNRDKHHDFTRLEYAPKCVRTVDSLAPPKAFFRDAMVMDTAPTAPLPSVTLVFTTNINSFLSLPHTRISKHKGSITKIAFDNLAVVRNARSTFMFDPTTDEVHLLHDLLKTHFDVDFYAYDTLAKLGEALMYSYHCYEDVPQLAGKPAVFIKQCAPKICIQPAYRKPVHVTGSLVQIDRNGSYTATYTEFEGIPKGAPKVIDPERWSEIKHNATYYYVLIDVHSARCRHLDDRFELVTVGEITPQGGHGSATFIDRNMLEFIEQHYDIDYTFISGYYFDSGFNTNIKRLATDLYRLRQQLKRDGQRIESCIKTILSSLWGKAQPKRRITKEVSVTRDRLDDFVVYNKDFLSRSTPVTDDVTIFSLLNPVTLHYTRPQFSTNVLSHARTTLNSIFYRAADNDIPIYYSNTDSLVLNTADLDKLNRLGGNDLIGDDLGQFKRERENICTFICLSPKKYIQRTVGDVDTKIVGLRRKNGADITPTRADNPQGVMDSVEQMFADWYSSSVSDDRDGRPVDLPGHSPDD